jgi:hypothetical protein
MRISPADILYVFQSLGDFAREVQGSEAVQKQAIYALFNVAPICREFAENFQTKESQRYFLRMFQDAAFCLRRVLVQLFLAIDMHRATCEPKLVMAVMDFIIEILNGYGEKGLLDSVVCTLDYLFENGRHMISNWVGEQFLQNGGVEAILDLLDDCDVCDETKNAAEKMFNRYFNEGIETMMITTREIGG